MTEHEIKKRILDGTAPPGLRVSQLDFSDSREPFVLPEHLSVTHLKLNGCQQMTELPNGLQCYHLEMRRSGIRALPRDIQVEYKLDLRECVHLTALPRGLNVGCLDLAGCISLHALPEDLDVNYLDVTGCTSFECWPQQARIQYGHLSLRGCPRVSSLPPWLQTLAQLDIRGCELISELPEGLIIGSWLDLAHTGITRLPESLHDAQLHWHGVPITPRIAFQPESITAAEILQEPNLELRRVLLERCGYERFLKEAEAEILDQDFDPGGERRLLCVPMEDDEDLVCLSVLCPSTGRQYLLRVPPGMTTCWQAAAWIAGFDDPERYTPLIET